MASRRSRYPGLGFRAHPSRPDAQAGGRDGAPRFRRFPLPRRPDVAVDFGRGLHAQWPPHHPGYSRQLVQTSLSEFRSHCGGRWLVDDDVDLCWRLQERGGTLGFSPAAMVWHHRRNSIRAYWRQQKGYGRAEALLQQKWPEKYNLAGYFSWTGRIYGKGVVKALGQVNR